MNRSDYYEKMKALAREERIKFGFTTPRMMKSQMRGVYKKYGIRIDLWPYRLREVRGAYFFNCYGASVLLNGKLPYDPLIFTMAHELKHHLVDRDLSIIYCGDRNKKEPIEIGAEVFAAEFIFPEKDFQSYLFKMGIGCGECTPETLVRLKHETKTTLSYASLSKRAVFMRFAEDAVFARIQWKKLEEQIYGEPLYKQIQRHRHRSKLPNRISN